MEFFLEPPLQPMALFGNAWRVFGDGVIDASTPANFDALVREHCIARNSSLYINSPGGSLAGGMGLGREIRRAGFLTYVGARGTKSDDGAYSRYTTRPGRCLSAATLAFLGGVFRWIDNNSDYGVHRFYAAAGDIGSDAAQIASSEVVQYLQEMGVDTSLFAEMALAGRDGINVLSRQKLESLNVIKTRHYATRWSVECQARKLYLKGERSTWRGVNKFIVYRDNGRVVLHIIFDPEGRGDEATNLLGAHSLMIDSIQHPVTEFRIGDPYLINGLVNASYVLPEELVMKLTAATHVGVIFQFHYDAPTFLGFDNLEMIGGREKLCALIEYER